MASRDGMDGDLDDDFTLEVSDLRTGQVMETRLTSSELGASPSVDADEDELSITPLDADAPAVAQPAPLRLLGRRRTRSLVVIGLAVVGCLAIVLNLPGVQQGLQEAFNSTTPTITGPIAPGGNVIYFEDIVPWGKLTVDGNAIPYFGDSAVATLARGRHQVQVAAEPFAAMRCVVSVPVDNQHDTCPLGSGSTSYDTTGIEEGARYVEVGETPDKLPSGVYNELFDTISAALSASRITTTVAPGDHYLGADGAAIATEPLVASLTLDVNTDATRPFPSEGLCVSFCPYDQLGGTDWNLEVHTLAQWHFSTASGAYIPSTDAEMDTSFTVSVQWLRESWRLDPFAAEDELNNFCEDALYSSSIGSDSITQAGTGAGGGFYENIGSAPSVVDGCAIVASSSNDFNVRPLPADAVLFLYRFGVVLAGNDLSHTRQPLLPVATDAERALALQWLEPYS